MRSAVQSLLCTGAIAGFLQERFVIGNLLQASRSLG